MAEPQRQDATNLILSRTDEGDGAGGGEGGASRPVTGEALPVLPVLDERRFTVGEEKDRGGVGRVLVTHDRVLGRHIAVKQLQRAGDGAAAARFLREALVTARLEHPAIVPVYDVGERASGEPYYAMRLVDGTTLKAAIEARRGLDERLALLPHVVAVAHAVAYAHGRGIVHRDLKPGNVLVGPHGETLVIDWGLAKDLRADAPEAASSAFEEVGLTDDLTRAGAVMGTPGYMAPEQARGEPADERADVYALGGLLYHLLAGKLPGPDPKPVDTLEPGAPRDLVAVVGKAMAAAPADRYPTARELAADLDRFATGQLVGARRYTRGQLLRRWARRHRAPLLVAGALGALLAVVAAASAVAVVGARDRATAEANRLRFLQAVAVVDRDPTEALAWLAAYTPEPGSATRVRDVAARAAAAGVAADVLTLPDEAPLRVCLSPDGRQAGVVARSGAIWHFDREARTRRKLGSLGVAPEYCAFTPDGKHLAALAMKGGVRVAALPDGEALAVDVPAELWGFRALPDGRLLVTARDQRVFLVDPATRAARPLAHLPAGTMQAVPTPDGQTLLASDSTGKLWRVPLEAGAAPVLAGDFGSRIYGLSASLDGRHVVFGTSQEVVELDLAGGEPRRKKITDVPGDPVSARAVRGGAVFVGGNRLTVGFWKNGEGRDEVQVLGEQGFYKSLRVSADGARAVWVDLEGVIHVADLEAGVVTRLVGHHTAIRDLALTPDGRWLATTHGAGARVFALPPPSARRFVVGSAETQVRALPGRGEYVVAEFGTTLAVYAARTGARRVLGETGGVGTWSLVPHPDGRWLAVGLADGRVLLADLDAGTLVERARIKAPADSLAFAGDQLLAVTGRELVAWPLADAAAPARTVASLGDASPLAVGTPALHVSGDGRRVMLSTLRWSVVVELDGGRQQPLSPPGSAYFSARLPGDGARAVFGLADGRVVVQDVATGAVRELGRQDGFVNRLELTPDGRSVIVAGEAGLVQRFDLDGVRPPETLGAHDARVHVSAPSPSGARLATGDLGGHVRVHAPATGGAVVLVGKDEIEPHQLAFAGEDHVALLDKRGGLRFFTLATGDFVPAAPAALAAWLAARTTARLGEGGKLASGFRELP